MGESQFVYVRSDKEVDGFLKWQGWQAIQFLVFSDLSCEEFITNEENISRARKMMGFRETATLF